LKKQEEEEDDDDEERERIPTETITNLKEYSREKALRGNIINGRWSQLRGRIL